MAETVVILSTCIVRPSRPTSPHHMFLAAPDFLWRWFHYNQRILFFKLPNLPPLSSESFIAHLKDSLASALVEFFPWAGRCFEQENGRLALDCNDAGVPFIEAYVDLPFSTLENDGFQYQPFFKNMAPHGDVVRWSGPDLPLLSVQVTRFLNDEGFVLGIGHSHIVADGSSLWHFMKSWEEENDKAGPPFPEGVGSHLELAQYNFHFTSEMVRKLKNMATASYPTGHVPFSSLQALSAHMWRHMIEATDVDESRNSGFFLMANMRSRMKPPLPEGYFGNAINREGTIARKGELQQESLGATALRIQRLIEMLDETLMRTLYGKVEVLPLIKIMEEMDFSIVMFQLSSSPRFPVYDVDFGWGPPLSVQCPRIRGDGEMVWFPGQKGGGSIDISLALPKPAMERLRHNEGFLSF
ncbi:hypothetical protein GOP47_0022756 [Adiantum capillus-veneris]|uniref:Uncharacterized protein n=1 Tax=Adiantum capillus-veneris TaxID=13818 RepID=A0A9D4U734_ADICA|nr:hypothetical protein GOP47_0022756 [Adiantum capillus-veneris]